MSKRTPYRREREKRRNKPQFKQTFPSYASLLVVSAEPNQKATSVRLAANDGLGEGLKIRRRERALLKNWEGKRGWFGAAGHDRVHQQHFSVKLEQRNKNYSPKNEVCFCFLDPFKNLNAKIQGLEHYPTSCILTFQSYTNKITLVEMISDGQRDPDAGIFRSFPCPDTHRNHKLNLNSTERKWGPHLNG